MRFGAVFQHTAARRRLHLEPIIADRVNAVSTHSHPKAAAFSFSAEGKPEPVSTHSHPKAAAFSEIFFEDFKRGFNTQPPEGGCNVISVSRSGMSSFNTQPPEGGCRHKGSKPLFRLKVSTHSHPKAAARTNSRTKIFLNVSTHSHPKVAANVLNLI